MVSVEIDGDNVQSYATLAEAWAAAQAAAQANASETVQAKITILQDLSIAETFELTEPNCEITLSVADGKTLTVPQSFSGSYAFIVKAGKLTWASGKVVTDLSSNYSVNSIFSNKGGQLQIQGGELNFDKNDADYSLVQTSVGITTISGGTLTAAYTVAYVDGGELFITGDAKLSCNGTLIDLDGGKLTISGTAELKSNSVSAIRLQTGDLYIAGSPQINGKLYGIIASYRGSEFFGTITIDGDNVQISGDVGIDLSSSFLSTCSISGKATISGNAGAGINAEGGTLKIIGNDVDVKGTTDALSVKSPCKAELSGGKFTGGSNSSITVDSGSVDGLLASGYVYYKDDVLEEGNGSALQGVITVKPGDITIKEIKQGDAVIDPERKVTVQYGDPLNLTVEAESASGTSLTYQWFDADGTSLGTEKTCTYRMTDKTKFGEDNSPSVYCVVSNEKGRATTKQIQIVVDPRELTVTGTKTYNGETGISLSDIEWVGVLPVDEKTVTVTAASVKFDNANAGDAVPMTVQGVTLSGTHAQYYTLSDAAAGVATGVGIIEKAPLTLTGAQVAGKTYDGLPTAEVESGSAAWDGLVETETLTEGTDYTISAEFQDSNAGDARTADVTAQLLSDGETAKNYVLSGNSCTATAKISPVSVTLVPQAPQSAAPGTEFTVTLKDLPGYVSEPVTLTCSGQAAITEGAQLNTWKVVLPEEGEYTFTAALEHSNYTAAPVTFTVTAARNPVQPELTLTASPSGLNGGGEVTLTAQGVPEGVTPLLECDDAGIQPTETGNNTWSVNLPNVTKTYTFTLTAGDGTANCSVEVTQIDPDTLSLFAEPKTLVGGGEVTLTAYGVPEGVTPLLECDDTSIRFTEAGNNTWNVTLPNETKTYTFTITANGDTAECSVKVTQIDPNILSLSAEPENVTGGGAVKLTAYGVPEGVTPVLECDDDTIHISEAGNNTWNVNLPNETKTYTFTLTADGRTATCTVEATQRDDSDTLSLSAQPETLTGGGAVTLTALGVPEGVTAVLECDDDTIRPTEAGNNTWNVNLPNTTKTYTFTLTADGKTAECTVSVTEASTPVEPGELTLTARPNALTGGGAVTLTAHNVPEGVTPVLECDDETIRFTEAGNNTWNVNLPNETKTYTFTLTADGKTATCSVSVTRREDPIPPEILSLSVRPETLTGGGAVTLTAYGVPEGATAVLECDDGTIHITGTGNNTWSANLPNVTKTYTFTLTADGKTAECTVSVTEASGPVEPGALTLTARPEALTGGGTVTLTARGVPEGARAVLECSDPEIKLSSTGNNTWNVNLPNVTKTYTFTLTADGESAACSVTVTEQPHLPSLDTDDDGNDNNGSNTPEYIPPRTEGAGGASSKYIPNKKTQPSQPTTGTPNVPQQPTVPETPTAPQQPAERFADVRETEWYYSAVNAVVSANLMSGTGNGFEPEKLLTRGMLAQILYQHAGTPQAPAGTRFTDVPETEWYAHAVNWAAEAAIVSGYADGRFGANDSITREQLAVMLWRYAGTPAPSTTELNFADASEASAYAAEALCWAVENGILSGKSGNRLDPKGAASRAEAAQMLSRYLSLNA